MEEWKKALLDELIDNLTLFDDALMTLVFDGNKKAAELVLRIVLERDDITVKEVKSQFELQNSQVEGRNVRLDIWAQDSTGREFDIEIQKANAGAELRRARFNSSMLDSRMLREGQEFKELRDSYVIFLTQKDVIGAGCPLYHIDRMIAETGKSAGDGSHILYVNGAYQGDDPVGRLVHDFRCKNASEMYYEALYQGVQHFKEIPERKGTMSELELKFARQFYKEELEKNRKEALAEGMAQGIAEGMATGMAQGMAQGQMSVVTNLLRTGRFTPEELAPMAGLSVEEVRAIQL